MKKSLLYLGDCREILADLPEASMDACVTDPPYELGFMGKGWDRSGVAFDPATWTEVYRVLKPGAHLLAFGGTRTYHRMVCAIEDAGFEIRDCVMWIYGSGFPKSLDVAKAIDKAAGAKREVVGRARYADGHVQNSGAPSIFGGCDPLTDTRQVTAAATEDAKRWAGFGTALKPAFEPIVVARKPLDGTVVANVLAHGTGALNIDGCRVAGPPRTTHAVGNIRTSRSSSPSVGGSEGGWTDELGVVRAGPDGRWPANLIHDGSEEVLALFPETKSGDARVMRCAGRADPAVYHPVGASVKSYRGPSAGSAARFFYCAKAKRSERHAFCPDGIVRPFREACAMFDPKQLVAHPTVKPLSLMRHLVRLVTPPGGMVLDPFMGSGSTGKAAGLEKMSFVGCELDVAYLKIAEARIAAAA